VIRHHVQQFYFYYVGNENNKSVKNKVLLEIKYCKEI